MGNGMNGEDEQQLTISGLCELLAGIQRTHGDLRVVIRDADTGWNFKLLAAQLVVVKTEGGREKLVIGCGYLDPIEADYEEN